MITLGHQDSIFFLTYNIIASSHYLSDVSVENRLNTTALIERFRMFYDSTLKIVMIKNEFSDFSSSIYKIKNL